MHVPKIFVGEMVPTVSNIPSNTQSIHPAQPRRKRKEKENERARVTIQESRRFDHLSAVPAPFTFENVVGVALCLLVVQEKLSKIVDGEMSFGSVRLVVDHAGG